MRIAEGLAQLTGAATAPAHRRRGVQTALLSARLADAGRMLSVAVHGDGCDLLAELYGWTWGGCGYIDLLWVREDQCGSGLGAGLLATAEAEIRRRGCDRAALGTHSFQAPGFYARCGYTECGRTPGYPHGHDDIRRRS